VPEDDGAARRSRSWAPLHAHPSAARQRVEPGSRGTRRPRIPGRVPG